MSLTVCIEAKRWLPGLSASPRLLWFIAGACSILFAAIAGKWIGTDPGIVNFDPLRLEHMLVLAAALLGFAFLYRKPESGLLLLLALLYSNASEVAVRFHGLPSILQGLALLLGLVVVGRGLSEPREKLRCDMSLMLAAAYCIVLFASSALAANPSLADKRLIEQAKCLLIFALVINLVRSRVTLDRATWTILIVGAALSTISSLQVLTSSYSWDFGGFGRIKEGAQIVGDMRRPRVSGPLSDPNFYAQILIPLIPLGLYRLRDEKSAWRRLFGAYASAVCLLTLLFTYSRGAILALGIMLGILLMILRPPLKHCLAGVALLGLAVLLIPPQFEQRLGTLSQFVDTNESAVAKTDSSFRQRALLMRAAWEMWRDHPIAGVGAGNYPARYQEYADRVGSDVSSYEEFGEERFAHSLYLETGAETGLAGLSVFLAILIVVGVKGWSAVRIFRRLGDLKTARLVTSLMIGLTGYLTTSLFLHASYPRYLWLLLALIAASAQIAQKTLFDKGISGPA
ncbi:MAG: O-antigen ligase family protein [Acidobacteria bacterium]|nr:O-antigen ligase family protein [Acidobacteriota bacterium]